MKQTRRAWLAFLLAFVLALAAMAYVSAVMIGQDRRQRQALQADKVEELTRLALWRLDAAMMTIVAQESARPFAHYQPQHTVTYQPEEAPFPQTMLLPSPLRERPVPMVRLHFRIEPDGQVRLPYDDTRPVPRVGGPAVPLKPMLADKTQLAGRLEAMNRQQAIYALLPQVVAAQPPPAAPAGRAASANPRSHAERNAEEFILRDASNSSNTLANFYQYVGDIYTPSRDGETRAVWVDGQLLLGRRVIQQGRACVAGCWLDWPVMAEKLRRSIADLLPAATLHPIGPDAPPDDAARLATLPVRLDPGAVASTVDLDATGTYMALAVAWAGLLLAAGAVGAALRGALLFSERRAIFATAVTHELRTPLTSMRMYTELLADDAVADDAKRKAYHATLHAETERLCELVENVLRFARVSSAAAMPAAAETITIGDLLDEVGEPLAQRARRAEMPLEIDADDAARAAAVHAGRGDLEQILLNLIDNASKYARDSGEPIRVEAAIVGRQVELRVRDRGPGVPADEARAIFRPFSKSRRDAPGTRPGVGLGLAISRRLARQNHALLTYRPNPPGGACFVLALPRA